jgi:hypothetical protein
MKKIGSQGDIMKHIAYILLIAMALLALTACGNKVENAAKSFFDAMERQDFEAAKAYTTEQGQQLLSMMQSFAENMSEEQKEGYEKLKYNILETVEDGDSAIVTFEQWEVNNPEDKDVHELKLKKIDGSWKVDLAKEDLDK